MPNPNGGPSPALWHLARGEWDAGAWPRPGRPRPGRRVGAYPPAPDRGRPRERGLLVPASRPDAVGCASRRRVGGNRDLPPGQPKVEPPPSWDGGMNGAATEEPSTGRRVSRLAEERGRHRVEAPAQLTIGSRGMWFTRSHSPLVTMAVSPMHMLSPVLSSSRAMWSTSPCRQRRVGPGKVRRAGCFRHLPKGWRSLLRRLPAREHLSVPRIRGRAVHPGGAQPRVAVVSASCPWDRTVGRCLTIRAVAGIAIASISRNRGRSSKIR